MMMYDKNKWYAVYSLRRTYDGTCVIKLLERSVNEQDFRDVEGQAYRGTVLDIKRFGHDRKRAIKYMERLEEETTSGRI